MRIPVEGLGLEHTAVQVEQTHIVTDALCQTAEPGVYAIGDVAGPPWLAHKASHEGVMCVEHIAGLHPHELDPKRVPACTYSHPQVASVGLTETQARTAGFKLKVGKFPFSANGKAIAMGTTSGFAKVVFDEASGELLGAHLVGPLRQNSCRPDMILNLGAIRMNDGTVRRSIQEQDGGAVIAAGGRQCRRGGERNWSIGADIGTMA